MYVVTYKFLFNFYTTYKYSFYFNLQGAIMSHKNKLLSLCSSITYQVWLCH